MRPTKEARTIVWNDRPIVRVEGMVMIRSDLGFSPYMGYDNSRVAIYESENRSYYLIYGYKIKDTSVVTLNDLIPPRMSFTKASPIFHHWVIGDRKMGLTFGCTADGRSFDRGIRVALENLEKVSGSGSASDESSSATPTSIDSFHLPAVDDVLSPDNKPIVAQHSCLSSPGALSIAPKFRPHAMSASSRRQLVAPRSQRSHSSSAPDRPRKDEAHAEHSKPLLNPSELASSLKHSAPLSLAKEAKTEDSTKLSSSSITDVIRPPPIIRRHKARHRSESAGGNSSHRRRTKTPNLDHLERQRDLQPTKPNPYVQIASSKSSGTRGSSGADYFTRLSSRTTEPMHLTYSTSRFLSQRSFSDYRYRGLNCIEDGRCDFPTVPLHPVYTSSMKKNSKRSESKRNSDKLKEDLGERSRCKNCQAMFNLDANPPGSCPESPPDNFEHCIEKVSCMCVPHRVLDTCCRGSADFYDQEPCTCARRHRNSSSVKRWLVYGFASIFFPCICMYPLLRSCHRCGVASQCCGGRHQAIPYSPPDSSSSIKLS